MTLKQLQVAHIMHVSTVSLLMDVFEFSYDTLSNLKFVNCFETLSSYQMRISFAGLLTSFGLDLFAEKLCGPTVDRATLQLVGVLFASILLPGLLGNLWHSNRNIDKGACCSRFNKEGKKQKHQMEVLPSQSNARSCDSPLPCRVSWRMGILLGTLQGQVAVYGQV
eukprot:4046620-Amphidinium_carterae.1